MGYLREAWKREFPKSRIGFWVFMLMSRFCGCFKRPNGNGGAALLVVVLALVVAELLPEVTLSLLVLVVVAADGEEEAKASIMPEGPRNDGADEVVGGG